MRCLILAFLAAPALLLAQTETRVIGQITDLRVSVAGMTPTAPLHMTSTPDWLASVDGFRDYGVTATRILHDYDSATVSRPTSKELGPWARLVYEGLAPARIALVPNEAGELTLSGDSVEVIGAFADSGTRQLVARGKRIRFTRDTTGVVFVTAASVRVER